MQAQRPGGQTQQHGAGQQQQQAIGAGLLSQQQQSDTDAEISLLDILRFLKDAYKTILAFGVLGITLSIAYLVINPK
jgi:uncharacterized protein involved in exopolysaccharide biosynthesis